MVIMTDKEFINKFDNNIDFSADEILSICDGDIGNTGNISESPDEQFTRTFQVEGRSFRAYWHEPISEGDVFKVREMQSRYDYIHSLNIHGLAEYLRNFGSYCKSRDDEISLCEIKCMLAEFREDCM